MGPAFFLASQRVVRLWFRVLVGCHLLFSEHDILF